MFATALLIVGNWSVATAADSSPTNVTVSLATATEGSVDWNYLELTASNRVGSFTHPLPTRRTTYCEYSTWVLVTLDAVTGQRQYAIYIYDACQGDTQIIPANPNECVNSDGHKRSALPSTCITLGPRHLPVGLTPATCGASAEASVALHADVTPHTYDASQPTTLTATTSFGPDFSSRLSDAECVGDITWQTVGWTLVWPDGQRDQLPPSGQNGITAAHDLAPHPAGSPSVPSAVTAIAHLHIHGTALDFDPAGNVITTTRDAFVDISNNAAANGTGATPTYTPPRLAAGAVAAAQADDGALPALPASGTPSTHVDALYGRILCVWPRAVVVSPGTESVGGVVIGTGVTTTSAWTYDGGWTDAPRGEGTPPGTTGTAAQSIRVQYNHVEQLNSSGDPVDQLLPVTLTATTVYPDGHSTTQTFTGDVAITIYYVGLANA